MNRKNNFKKDIDNYDDIHGISSKKLNLGLWYVERKKLFKKIIIIVLIVISTISWLYTIYSFSHYYFKGIIKDEKMVKDMITLDMVEHEYILSKMPNKLIVSRVSEFNVNEKYDFFVEMKNTDKNFMARYEYCFIEKNNEFECADDYIYPNESKYIMALGEDFDHKPSNLRFYIKNLRWKRINLHKILNWKNFHNEHINVLLENIEFNSPNLKLLSEKLNLNSLKFTAINNSPYNYWDINYKILFYKGNNIISINNYKQVEFMSKQEVDIIINWPGNIGRISNVEIIPEIDIMDNKVYIEYDGDTGEIK